MATEWREKAGLDLGGAKGDTAPAVCCAYDEWISYLLGMYICIM